MWIIETTDLFAEWLKEQDKAMQLDMIAALNLLKQEALISDGRMSIRCTAQRRLT